MRTRFHTMDGAICIAHECPRNHVHAFMDVGVIEPVASYGEVKVYPTGAGWGVWDDGAPDGPVPVEYLQDAPLSDARAIAREWAGG